MILTTDNLDKIELVGPEKLWVYNALDCCITNDIYESLKEEVKDTKRSYDFERGMLGPALTMMRRGIKVDSEWGEKECERLTTHAKMLRNFLDKIAFAVWDKGLNPGSPVQLKKFFFEALAIQAITKAKKGQVKVSTDREAMEKLREFPRAKVFANTILAIRDAEKKTSVLKTKLSPDKRLRCSFNVAGTETGRWSSSESAFKEGTNLQNITKELRRWMVADDGQVMFYADLEQAESRVVAYIAGDDGYINACESGDLHTTVVKMVWPDKGWSGDPVKDRKIADEKFYLHFSHRDICKRAGHGTNYGLTYRSLARHLKIEEKAALKFQLNYYGGTVALADLERWYKAEPDGGYGELIEKGKRVGPYVEVEGAFPGIRRWHNEVAQALESEGMLWTPFGRRRVFWGRPNDAATLREAIAYVPQSTVGDLLNVGLYRVWNELEPEVQILGQIHDAVLGQFDKKEFDKWAPAVVQCLTNPLKIGDRMMVIPSTIELGYNAKDMVDYAEFRPN